MEKEEYKLPEEIRVGSDYIKIIEERLKKQYGLYDHDNLIIRIDSRQPFKRRFRTLIHELLHYIDSTNFLRLNHSAIYIIADRLLAIFHDNPELRKLLDNYCSITHNYNNITFKLISKLTENGKTR